MRGMVISCPLLDLPQRFIPAYAGNGIRDEGKWMGNRVYPRIRGEWFVAGIPKVLSRGLSPHTRGMVRSSSVFSVLIRFIPAYAGNGTRDKACSVAVRVYPRIRGEWTKKTTHFRSFCIANGTFLFTLELTRRISSGSDWRNSKHTTAKCPFSSDTIDKCCTECIHVCYHQHAFIYDFSDFKFAMIFSCPFF